MRGSGLLPTSSSSKPTGRSHNTSVGKSTLSLTLQARIRHRSRRVRRRIPSAVEWLQRKYRAATLRSLSLILSDTRRRRLRCCVTTVRGSVVRRKQWFTSRSTSWLGSLLPESRRPRWTSSSGPGPAGNEIACRVSRVPRRRTGARLTRACSGAVRTRSRFAVDPESRNRYYLFFGTGHSDGLKEMKGVLLGGRSGTPGKASSRRRLLAARGRSGCSSDGTGVLTEP